MKRLIYTQHYYVQRVVSAVPIEGTNDLLEVTVLMEHPSLGQAEMVLKLSGAQFAGLQRELTALAALDL